MTDKILNLILKDKSAKHYYNLVKDEPLDDLLTILKTTNMGSNHYINVYKRARRQNRTNNKLLNDIDCADVVYILNYLINTKAGGHKHE